MSAPTPAASIADETWLKIGQPDVIGRAIDRRIKALVGIALGALSRKKIGLALNPERDRSLGDTNDGHQRLPTD